MAPLPGRQEQIIRAHAPLIVQVVKVSQNRALMLELEPVLQAMKQYGQEALVGVLMRIIEGSREPALVGGLDEDDAIIVNAILRGLQDPATLPDPNAQADPTAAAPGLAHMINEAAHGNVNALHTLANMSEQMSGVGGDMARLAAIMRRLIDGERDPEILCKGMGPLGESLVLSILESLAQLDSH